MVRPTIPLTITAEPVEGAAAVFVPFPFTPALQSFTFDLTQEMAIGAIGFVQSIYIDNRANAQPFIITFQGTQYAIQVRPGRAGIWPVIAQQGPISFTGQSAVAANFTVNTLLMNCEMPYIYTDN